MCSEFRERLEQLQLSGLKNRGQKTFAWEPGRGTAGPSTTLPRISYIAAPTTATYAAFRKESRIKLANAIKVDRKFGVA
jgi:hypothetical protein